MLLDNDITNLGLKACRTSTKVKDEFTLIKLNFLAIVLGDSTNDLKNILTILKREVILVAQCVRIVGHIRILIDLDSHAFELHVGMYGNANVISLTSLDVQGHSVDGALSLPL